MTCDCHSHNGSHGERPEVVLTPPPVIAATRADPSAGICVDACIADTVAALWASGVLTLGSCCGHGRESPSLVLADGEDPSRAAEVLVRIDRRRFTLLQWQLADVTHGAFR